MLKASVCIFMEMLRIGVDSDCICEQHLSKTGTVTSWVLARTEYKIATKNLSSLLCFICPHPKALFLSTTSLCLFSE